MNRTNLANLLRGLRKEGYKSAAWVILAKHGYGIECLPTTANIRALLQQARRVETWRNQERPKVAWGK